MNNIFSNVFYIVKSILRNGITGTIGAEMGEEEITVLRHFSMDELERIRRSVKGSCARD